MPENKDALEQAWCIFILRLRTLTSVHVTISAISGYDHQIQFQLYIWQYDQPDL